MGHRTSALLWIERGLFAVGIALAAWCAITLIEARFVEALRIPRHDGIPRQDGIPHQYVDVNRGLPGDTGAEPGTKGTTGGPAPSAGTVLGKLEMPTLHLDATVLEGSDDATLSRGAGHIEDTPFPDDTSSNANVGIAGHRDTIFRPLRHVKAGDPLTLRTARGVYHYRVSKTMIVNPDDVYVLDATGKPTVTLVTCYPFEFIGHAPKRFIVQAELEKAGEAGRAGSALPIPPE